MLMPTCCRPVVLPPTCCSLHIALQRCTIDRRPRCADPQYLSDALPLQYLADHPPRVELHVLEAALPPPRDLHPSIGRKVNPARAVPLHSPHPAPRFMCLTAWWQRREAQRCGGDQPPPCTPVLK